MTETIKPYLSDDVANYMLDVMLALKNKTAADYGADTTLPEDYKLALFSEELDITNILSEHAQILVRLFARSAEEIGRSTQNHETKLLMTRMLKTGEANKRYPNTTHALKIVYSLTSEEHIDLEFLSRDRIPIPSASTALGIRYYKTKRRSVDFANKVISESEYDRALGSLLNERDTKELLTRVTDSLEEAVYITSASMIVPEGSLRIWKTLSRSYIDRIIQVKALEDRGI